jgi:hypothetical protein
LKDTPETPLNQCRRRESKPGDPQISGEKWPVESTQVVDSKRATPRVHDAPVELDTAVDTQSEEPLERLTTAIVLASQAGQWAVVQTLAKQLEALTVARAGNVIPLRREGRSGRRRG